MGVFSRRGLEDIREEHNEELGSGRHRVSQTNSKVTAKPALLSTTADELDSPSDLSVFVTYLSLTYDMRESHCCFSGMAQCQNETERVEY